MPLLSALSSVFSSARDLIYTPPINSSGAEVVTTDGRSLPLLGAKLIATAKGGIARVVLEQTFANRHDEILHVTYRMPLPADGAVSAYAFEIDGRVIRGKVDRKHEARATFERAVASGKTAALLEQNRSDIFTQEIGNLPANKTLIARITVDQRLAWLPEGEWELRFPTVIGPRYVGASDTAADSHDTVVAVAAGPITARVQVAVSIGDRLLDGRRPSSPSHAIKRDSNGDLELATEAALDRDIVVRWPVATREVGLALDVARPAGDDHAYGLLTIVPPASAAKAVALPRDLIVLFDTSGSMSGAPLDKAKHTIAMLIESLGELDRLEVIEFSSDTHRWQTDPVAATEANKRDAIRWVRSRQANGGTEMASALRESLHALRIGAQRQVVLVTDGYIGGEQQVIQTLHDNLPKSCRLHVLGIGSAVNRSLATALARAGRGAEVLVGPDEDIERGTKRLVDRMRAPVLTNVEISGTALVKCAPEAMPDVFEGAPVVAGVALSPEGGELVVRGELAHGEARQGHPYRVATEAWIQRITVPPKRQGEGNQAIPALYAREHVADLEMRWDDRRHQGDRSRDRDHRRQVPDRDAPDVVGCRRRNLARRGSGASRGPAAGAAVRHVDGQLRAACSRGPAAADPGHDVQRADRRCLLLRRGRGVVRRRLRRRGDHGEHDAELRPRVRGGSVDAVGAVVHACTCSTGAAAAGADVEACGPDVPPGARAADRPVRRDHRVTSAREAPTPAGPRAAVPARGDLVPRLVARAVTDSDFLHAQIAAGDADAFGQWLAGAEPRVRGSLASFARVVDVEAVLQEALVRVWQVAPRFTPDGQPDSLIPVRGPDREEPRGQRAAANQGESDRGRGSRRGCHPGAGSGSDVATGDRRVPRQAPDQAPHGARCPARGRRRARRRRARRRARHAGSTRFSRTSRGRDSCSRSASANEASRSSR
jgi:Ca-activated chloride channel family protein